MPGGMVCTRCARLLLVAVMGRVTGHAPQCPDVVQTPSGMTSDWNVGYDAGWDAAREVLVADLIALYRARLGKLLRTARDAFDGAPRVDPQVLLDAVEKAAERDGLL